MKKLASLLLSGALALGLLAGCGGSGDGGGAAQTPDAANTSAVQENTGSAFKRRHPRYRRHPRRKH